MIQPLYHTLIIPMDKTGAATVSFNVMATTGAIVQLKRTMKAEDSTDIIGEITNWPEMWGEDPFDDNCPLLIRSWCCITGPQQAIGEWLSDPLQLTARSRSTKPTNKVGA